VIQWGKKLTTCKGGGEIMSPKVKKDASPHDELVQAVRTKLEGAGLEVKKPNEPIEWPGELKKLWPTPDILIENAKSGTEFIFIIEYDENNDPGRSITKYWPYIDKYNSTRRIIYIGVWKWKKDGAYGEGFFKSAIFIGEKFIKLYPSFNCHFIRRSKEERSTEVQDIACKIQEIVQAYSSATGALGLLDIPFVLCL
jgi:hypothetical protein